MRLNTQRPNKRTISMKRFIIFLLAVVLTFTACGTLQTKAPAPSPSPETVVSPTCAEPSTPVEQLLHDIGAELTTGGTPCDMTLCGTAEYNGRCFAMIAVEGVANTLHLVEYRETESGFALLAACDGWTFNVPGYIPIVSQFDDLIVCWSYITKQRMVPDDDGISENDVYIPNDYTAIRMTLADGTVHDEPITADLQSDNLFFCVLDPDNLPTGFVPLAGDTEVTEWATGTGDTVTPTPAVLYSQAP